jgi:hypothetical protein
VPLHGNEGHWDGVVEGRSIIGDGRHYSFWYPRFLRVNPGLLLSAQDFSQESLTIGDPRNRLRIDKNMTLAKHLLQFLS